MTAIDRKQLSGQIATRYGIRIDENDPAFVVANLSQNALEQALCGVAETNERSRQ
jgi:hypothetical protein